jgi:predicted PurR-regulated permease PerM
MSPLNRVLITGASIVIIVAGLRAASSLVGFVLLAALLAISLSQFVAFIVRKGVPRSLAMLITILILIVGGVFLTMYVGRSAAELVQTLPSYEYRLSEFRESLQSLLTRLGIDVNALFSREELDPRRIIQIAASLLRSALNAFSSSIFLLILIALMLVEVTSFETRIEKGEHLKSSISARLFEVRSDLRKFVSITALMGFFAAIANVILLIILGVDYPLLWGVVSFLLNFVPAVGNLIAMIPPFLMALLEFGWTKAILVIVGYIVINNIVDVVIKPKLMKQGLDISILLIFLSLMFWTWVLGTLGTILAVPLTLLIKRVLMEFSQESTAQSPFQSSVKPGELSSSEGVHKSETQ